MSDEKVEVKSYERRKPSAQKPRTDNASLESDPQSPGATEGGVRIMSKGMEKNKGVTTQSMRNKPGDPQTRIEVGRPDADRDEEGRRKFLRS